MHRAHWSVTTQWQCRFPALQRPWQSKRPSSCSTPDHPTAGTLLAGWECLPEEIQAKIITLARRTRKRCRSHGILVRVVNVTRDLPQVSRAFEAHAFLDAAKATVARGCKLTTRYTPAAMLPYLPLLQTIDYRDARLSRYLITLLTSQTLPSLTSLRLADIPEHLLPPALTAIAQHSQLTNLILSVRAAHAAYEPLDAPILPPLPHLRALSLRIDMLAGGEGVNARLGSLSLQKLGSMCALTRLSVTFPDLNRLPLGVAAHPITMSCIRYNMRCGVLGVNSATALRRLSLSQWAGDHTAELCWQELATSLPKLRHLTHLKLRVLPVTREGTAACLQVLAAGLSRLTRLRSFSIEGRPSEDEHLERSEDDEAWSVCFVQALSAMAGLERLRVKR